MADPETVLSDSPADFDSSLAYAWHGEMRRLLIVTIVGSLLLPIGLAMFLDPLNFADFSERLVRQGLGLLFALVGAAFFYGGVVAILFKIVTDASILAAEQ